MKKIIDFILTGLLLSVFCTGFVFAAGSDDMKGHDMTTSDKIGDLIHESTVDGYMLSYYLMDLREQKASDHSGSSNDMADKEMDKPHHLMVYIMDKNHKPVLKGKVGFMIKDDQGKAQKAMGMFMSKGFGTTADMKKKGIYNITTKAIVGDKKLMDKFNYEMK
jgi:hypothetical protein